jgi:hypothetical protein
LSLFLVGVEQNQLSLLNHYVENSMRGNFDFPELSLNLPELNPNGIKPVTLYLFKRFERPCPLRLSQTLECIPARAPCPSRS